jgi:hypothetical protein
MFPVPDEGVQTTLDYSYENTASHQQHGFNSIYRQYGNHNQPIFMQAKICDEMSEVYTGYVIECKHLQSKMEANTASVIYNANTFDHNSFYHELLFDQLCSDILTKLFEYLHYSSKRSLLIIATITSTAIRRKANKFISRKHTNICELQIASAVEYIHSGGLRFILGIVDYMIGNYLIFYIRTVRRAIIEWGGTLVYVRLHNTIRYRARNGQEFIENYPLDGIIIRSDLAEYNDKWTRGGNKIKLGVVGSGAKFIGNHHVESGELKDNLTAVCKCQWMFGTHSERGMHRSKTEVMCAHCMGDRFTHFPTLPHGARSTYLEVREYHFGDWMIQMTPADMSVVDHINIF